MKNKKEDLWKSEIVDTSQIKIDWDKIINPKPYEPVIIVSYSLYQVMLKIMKEK